MMHWITLLIICVGLIIIIILMPFIGRMMDKLWDYEEAWLERRREGKME